MQAHRLLQLEGAHTAVAPCETRIDEHAVEVVARQPRVLEREPHGLNREADVIRVVHLALLGDT